MYIKSVKKLSKSTESKVLKELHQLNIDVRTNEMLKQHTTLHIGGPAKFFVNVRNTKELISVLEIVRKYKLPFLVIGAGSNLLISDEGFAGVIVKLRDEFRELKLIQEKKIYAGAGVMLAMLIKFAVDNSLSGLEELFGIPGTVGGAIMMNAGTKNSTISDNLEFIEVLSISNPQYGVIKLYKEEINFGYRRSGLENFVILSSVFNLREGNKEELQKRITEVLLTRAKTQPLGTFNAGCIFKNPENHKYTAAMLIDKCNLKGFQCGDAYVSTQHANFIINKNNATSKDFVKIIKHIISVVKKKYKVKLEPEIKLVNIKL